jgi:hypothetical protein
MLKVHPGEVRRYYGFHERTAPAAVFQTFHVQKPDERILFSRIPEILPCD